jgi:hypothetical protein
MSLIFGGSSKLAVLAQVDVVKGWLFVAVGVRRAYKRMVAVIFGNKLQFFESVLF